VVTWNPNLVRSEGQLTLTGVAVEKLTLSKFAEISSR